MEFNRLFQTAWCQSKRQYSLPTDVLDIVLEVLSWFYLPFQANAKYFFQNSDLFSLHGHFPLHNAVCFSKYKRVTRHFRLLQSSWMRFRLDRRAFWFRKEIEGSRGRLPLDNLTRLSVCPVVCLLPSETSNLISTSLHVFSYYPDQGTKSAVILRLHTHTLTQLAV
jgi:hypothetical protein